MPSKDFHGKKGRSGRKSIQVEAANMQWLADFFFKKHTKEEIEQMLKENRSVSKQMLAKALAGNEKYTLAVFNKLFPDSSKLDITTGGKPIPIFGNVFNNDSHKEDQQTQETNPSDSGGNFGEQNSVSDSVTDSLRPVGQKADDDQHNLGELPASETGSNEGVPTDNEGAPILSGSKVE